MPSLSSTTSITVVPDWICEVLSNTTRRYDLRTKKPFYARMGVAFLWVVDSAAQVVTAQRLERGNWIEVGVWADETNARIPPFDEVEIDVSAWWTADE
jgi:Uma2 family endonuclease